MYTILQWAVILTILIWFWVFFILNFFQPCSLVFMCAIARSQNRLPSNSPVVPGICVWGHLLQNLDLGSFPPGIRTTCARTVAVPVLSSINRSINSTFNPATPCIFSSSLFFTIRSHCIAVCFVSFCFATIVLFALTISRQLFYDFKFCPYVFQADASTLWSGVPAWSLR